MGSGLERAEYDYPEPVSYGFVAPDPDDLDDLYDPHNYLEDDDELDEEDEETWDDDEMDDETWDDNEDVDEDQKEWDDAVEYVMAAMK